jgi:hypothetical protein
MSIFQTNFKFHILAIQFYNFHIKSFQKIRITGEFDDENYDLIAAFMFYDYTPGYSYNNRKAQ